MKTNAAASQSALLLHMRSLPETTARQTSGLANALTGIQKHTSSPALTSAKEPVSLLSNNMQLQREGLLQTLGLMKQEAYRQLEPDRAKSFSWMRSLNSSSFNLPVMPKSIAILENLCRKLENNADGLTHLDTKECALCSLKLEKLADRLPDGSPLKELSQRLAVMSQAAWAQLARAEVADQLLPQFERFNQPGSAQETNIGFSVGSGVGLSQANTGAKATFNVGLSWLKSVDNDDEGGVYRNKGRKVTSELGVKGGVGVASLSGSATGTYQHIDSVGYNSAKAYVTANVEKLGHASRRDTLQTTSRTIVGSLIRHMSPGHGNELQHFKDLQQQASDQQQRLGVLLGWLGQANQSASLPNSTPRFEPPSVLKIKTGDLVARAEAASVGVGVTATAEKMTILIPQLKPFWQELQSMPSASEQTPVMKQRQGALDSKAEKLFGSNSDKSPLSRLSGASSLESLRGSDLATLKQGLESLSDEYSHLCAIAQQRDTGVGRHLGGKKVENSLLASWQGRSREEAIGNMIFAHAVLSQAVSGSEAGSAAANVQIDKQNLLQFADSLADALQNPPIRHNNQKLAEATSFTDMTTLVVRDKSVALDIGGSLGSLGLKAEASLLDRQRENANPFRAGHYRDVVVSLKGNLGYAASMDALKDSLLKQLTPMGLAAEIPAALAGLEGSIGANVDGTVKLQFRFYQPDYQQQSDFPEEAQGFNLQLTRMKVIGNLGVEASTGVPVQPGVSLELGISGGTETTYVPYERWGSNSMTAPMMHFMHTKNVDESERWTQISDKQRPALKEMFKEMANPESRVKHEAEYFLKKLDDDGVTFFSTMQGYANGQRSFDAAMSEFNRLAENYFPLWQEQKAAFPGKEKLPFTR